MKKCELCNSLAKMCCESDQAILCWDCDSRVHGANFLVAKHSRTLLCHLCQSPTPWNGSGPKLGPTVSVCENCVSRNACTEEINNEETHHEEDDDDEDDEEEDDDDDDEDDGGDSSGDEENQVVPWTSRPPVSSSSTSEECSTKFGKENGSQSRTVHPLKRMRETVDPDDEEEDDDDDDEDDGGDSSGDEENQVVPWTSRPPVSSSSTSEECSTKFGKENGSQSRTVHPLKRMRETVDPDDEEEDDDDDDEDDGGDSSGDEENQVVPWTSRPPVSSSSTSEECSTKFGKENGSQSRTVHPLKRMRETVDPFSPVS